MNARWLTDLDVFNEWMNEEDYELTDADGSVSNEHLVFHFIDFSHLRSVPQEIILVQPVYQCGSSTMYM